MKPVAPFLFALALIAVGPGLAVAQMHHEGHASIEQLVVEMADTPKEHDALAQYYRGKAEHMRAMATEHRSMAKSYMSSKMIQRKRGEEHCGELAASFDKAAQAFDALAADHEAAAKQ